MNWIILLLAPTYALYCSEDSPDCKGLCLGDTCCEGKVCGDTCCGQISSSCINDQCLPSDQLNSIPDCLSSLFALYNELEFLLRSIRFGFYDRMIEQMIYVFRKLPFFLANCEMIWF